MVDREKAIAHVLRQEGAVSLGLAGRKLEVAVGNLRRHDAARNGAQPERRQQLLHNAALLLAAFVIQREALGIHDHADLDAQFGLTPELWNHVGVCRP